MRREIVHPAGGIYELPVRQALAHLLDGTVDIPEVGFHLLDRLPVQCDDEVKHAVRRRVLRADVDDEVALIRCTDFFNHDCCVRVMYRA